MIQHSPIDVVEQIDVDDSLPTPDNHVKQLQDAYLAAFSTDGGILRSAKLAGVGAKTVYKWLDVDRDFQANYQLAVTTYREHLEKSALLSKVDDPKCPPLLVIFALKGAWRDKYGDNVQPEQTAAAELLKRLEGMSAKAVKAAVVNGARDGVVV